MSTHIIELLWSLDDGDFGNNRYSRRHVLRFDGGVELAGSSSPAVVPEPWSDAAAVDPEEAFVASLSSCHMLWFLHKARDRGFEVLRYTDEAVGVMAKNADGQWAITRVTLHPAVVFGATRQAAAAELESLHHAAHEACFIANSVKTEILCEPVL